MPATELATRFGTPLYVMDEDDVRGRAAETLAAFTREAAAVGTSARVYYAGKAFLSIEVARWMVEEGLHIDVCSGGELAVALAGGADPARLGFHGNNKSVAEIDRAVGAGIGQIVVDSAIEVERVAAAAAAHGRVQPVRLRVNSGVHAHTHEYLATAREDQKFGITLADAPGLVARIRSHATLSFTGLHAHIGSQIFETDAFVESARRLLDLHERLLADGPVPELNLGGGFGIAYTSVDRPVPVPEIARRLARIVGDECGRRGISVPVIAVEPGRSIVGPSTVTLYTVGTVKDVLVTVGGVDGEVAEASSATGDVEDPRVAEEAQTAVRRYVSVDGGMSDNARPPSTARTTPCASPAAPPRRIPRSCASPASTARAETSSSSPTTCRATSAPTTSSPSRDRGLLLGAREQLQLDRPPARRRRARRRGARHRPRRDRGRPAGARRGHARGRIPDVNGAR
ncbi:Diaminopimelate decarboxylase [Clavibacter michiganensis subsp. michiganensis]|uniref:Diaminopimelate decarboxylase n=1 Tax=Clavibacter michiganensis subsp. michiganensis TaxID=33013 RepID=A0A251XGQ2_CLAMM|nr:Diaminopimelate decarboxylase [Clavibacter michiganensis subsp. michiganensis]OUE01580.1 Diaminopimelate decarboxylase [Clavibacter michiganensis subsp. michiganensis]